LDHNVPPAEDQVTSLTAIGGSANHGPVAFTTTHWSIVLEAQGPTPAAQEALEKLCRTYWWPLYGYVRRQGYGPEESQDIYVADPSQFHSRIVTNPTKTPGWIRVGFVQFAPKNRGLPHAKRIERCYSTISNPA
jgi:hypothetical protein